MNLGLKQTTDQLLSIKRATGTTDPDDNAIGLSHRCIVAEDSFCITKRLAFTTEAQRHRVKTEIDCSCFWLFRKICG